MSIDWFTFTAQVLNFLVLVWLMKRFLYGPILDAMDQREKRIAGSMASALTTQEQAANAKQEYDSQLSELNRTREEILAEGAREAATWRETHMAQAKNETEIARQQWNNALSREKQALITELQLTMMQQATDLSRHLLDQLADERLQKRLVDRFTKLLIETPDVQDLLRMPSGDSAAVVETSHVLTDEEQLELTNMIRRVSDADSNLEFRVNPKLICGIEVQTPGSKLAWSIRDSLAEMESELIDAIDQAIPSANEGPQSADQTAATC